MLCEWMEHGAGWGWDPTLLGQWEERQLWSPDQSEPWKTGQENLFLQNVVVAFQNIAGGGKLSLSIISILREAAAAEQGLKDQRKNPFLAFCFQKSRSKRKKSNRGDKPRQLLQWQCNCFAGYDHQ